MTGGVRIAEVVKVEVTVEVGEIILAGEGGGETGVAEVRAKEVETGAEVGVFG